MNEPLLSTKPETSQTEHVRIPIEMDVQNVRREQRSTLDLYKTFLDGDLEDVEKILDENPETIRLRLSSSLETPLMVAIKGGQNELIEKLIEFVSPEELALTDKDGNTALHIATKFGNIEVAHQLLTKNDGLKHIENKEGDLPLQTAVTHGQRDMTLELLGGEFGPTLLFGSEKLRKFVQTAVRVEMYTLAQLYFQAQPKLAWEDDKFNALEVMAKNPRAFRSGTPFNFWETLTYDHSESIAAGPIKKRYIEAVEEGLLDRICQRKAIHVEADNLLVFLCSKIKESFDEDKTSKVLKEPFLLAARNGIEEIVTKILDTYPAAISFEDEEKHSVFHIAVMYRYENIFKIACQKSHEQYKELLLKTVKNENNVLHLAGLKAHQNRLDLNPGIVLEMQSEIRWFKDLEKLVPTEESKKKNKDKKIRVELFLDDHEENMAKKEKQWMKGMAIASSVAASIIATMAFGAAITVPGGNNSNGLPMFSNKKSFTFFAVSDGLAFFSSIISLLTFISIFTSHFGVEDYLYVLPNRVIIGLISLFVAIISLMVAFSCTLFLVFAKKNALILLPLIICAFAPVVLYAFLQLPSLVNMIKTTYFRGRIYEVKSRRWTVTEVNRMYSRISQIINILKNLDELSKAFKSQAKDTPIL